MELRQLRYFIEVAKELHFGKAAQNLFVSQPALSQQIQLLESELGVELFDSTRRKQFRRAELTPAGQVFLNEAHKVIRASQRAVESTRQTAHKGTLVKLGIYKMLLRERIVEILTLFSEHFPEVNIQLVELPTYISVQEALVEGTIQLGMTLWPLRLDALQGHVYRKGHLCVILPKNHRLASDSELHLNSLKKEKWIEIPATLHPFYTQVESIFQQAGINRKASITQEVSSLDLVGELVSMNQGIALVPILFDWTRYPDILVKNIQWDADQHPLEIEYAIAYHPEHLTPRLKEMIQTLPSLP
ncbi:LysR family transcriptional regulator [Siphonobacter sp. SORGH_AS_1065]|uniref:LysR family transcriptional regulator n=1 Tax=Siphonobacter sp. SORGH_AS_1065 TaxID=3041795 RepID=UPI002789DD17|nr:LysR family transcriptional regulator [Siphonobacter sp. SORGH_AS_1065]MDQ1090214.1 DNA-binding transcriptional LysR family regulator [Siphonobacter sp. SORGH_AS_1065]